MFTNIKQKRIFEKIVDQVKDAVLSGQLKPGNTLPPETELARMLGVGRSAVREALRILELSGVIVVRTGKGGGAFVQNGFSSQRMINYFSDDLKIGTIDIHQLTEARFWIESIVIDVITEKAKQKDFDTLMESIDQSERFYRIRKEAERIHENFNFHILMAKVTENRVLVDMLSAIIALMSYMMVKVKPTPEMTQATIKAHRKILKCLQDRDKEKAKSANKVHINAVSEALIEKHLKQKRSSKGTKTQSIGKNTFLAIRTSMKTGKEQA